MEIVAGLLGGMFMLMIFILKTLHEIKDKLK